MSQHVTAIYEKGVLRLLEPVDLKDQDLVSLSIDKVADSAAGGEEDAYVPLIINQADESVTLERVHAALAKLPGSLVEDFDRERDERF